MRANGKIALLILLLVVCAGLPQVRADEFDQAAQAYGRGDFIESLRQARRTLKYSPQDIDAYYYQALSCQHLGYLKEAMEAYRKIVELSPKSATGLIAAEHLSKLSKYSYGKRSPFRLDFTHGERGPLLNCQLNGRPLTLRFDPGSEGIRLSKEEAVNLGLRYERIDEIKKLERRRFALLPAVIKIGGIEEQTLVTVMEDGGDNTIGADFFVLPYKIDENGRHIEFK